MRAVVAALVLSGALAGCGGDEPRPEAPKPTPTAAKAPATPEPTVTPEPRAAGPAGWSRGRVMRRLAGRRLRVGGRRVALDAATLACSGLGRPDDRTGDRRWTAFRCVQPTFPPGRVVGPDAVFVVQVTGDRRLRVTARRLTDY